MKDKKVKIVLDTDVILHFLKGGRFSLLPEIFQECEYIMLSTTYDELKDKAQRDQIDNQINFIRNITKIEFEPKGEMRKVYADLTKQFGRGESACMAYCQFENHVIGSNNTKDIKDYCTTNNIAYLTTADFLYYAITRGKMTEAQALELINSARQLGSNVPNFNYSTHKPTTIM